MRCWCRSASVIFGLLYRRCVAIEDSTRQTTLIGTIRGTRSLSGTQQVLSTPPSQAFIDQIMYWSDNNCAAKVGDVLTDYILADWHSPLQRKTAAAEPRTHAPVETKCSFCGGVCQSVHAVREASVKEALRREVWKFTLEDFEPVMEREGVIKALDAIYSQSFTDDLEGTSGPTAVTTPAKSRPKPCRRPSSDG